MEVALGGALDTSNAWPKLQAGVDLREILHKLLGGGGTGSVHVIIPETWTGTSVIVEARRPLRPRPRGADDLSPGAMLSFVRAHLSLNITELAAAMRVERPTIYSWLNERSAPQPNNYERLREVLGVAREWATRAKQPAGPWVRQPILEHGSLASLLTQESIDHHRVSEHLETLLSSVSQRAAHMGQSSIRAALKRRGVDPTSLPSWEDEIDALTGKRIAPEPDD